MRWIDPKWLEEPEEEEIETDKESLSYDNRQREWTGFEGELWVNQWYRNQRRPIHKHYAQDNTKMISYKGKLYKAVPQGATVHVTLEELMFLSRSVEKADSYFDLDDVDLTGKEVVNSTGKVDVDEWAEGNINGANISIHFVGTIHDVFCDEYLGGLEWYFSFDNPATLEAVDVVTDRPVIVHSRPLDSAVLDVNSPEWVFSDVFAESIWFGHGQPKLDGAISKGSLGAEVLEQMGGCLE